ncbi:hypothetical protein VNO77_30599 [Canavalia gladiata]|uniref:Uncharacterized protein n=1 Tax=Canavalia gladiata TaxID=3824 RepID=A0AAN9Q4B6_CANGL
MMRCNGNSFTFIRHSSLLRKLERVNHLNDNDLTLSEMNSFEGEKDGVKVTQRASRAPISIGSVARNKSSLEVIILESIIKLSLQMEDSTIVTKNETYQKLLP